MAASFPSSIVNLTNPNPATDDFDTLVGGLTHSGQHGKLNDEVEAIETKLGTGSSTPSSGTVLRGTGAGTSAYGQVMNADVATSAAIALSKVNITGEAAPSGGLVTGDKIAAYDVSAAVNAATTAGSILNLTSGDITITTGGVASIGTGKVTSTHILNSTIVAGDISATAGIYAGQTDPSVARLNLCDNPGFEVWSRGTAEVSTNGDYGPDRWTLGVNGGSTLKLNRETTTVDSSSVAAVKLEYTHVSSQSWMMQTLEIPAELRSRPLGVSMRAKCATANCVSLYVDDLTSGLLTVTHSGDNTWQTLSGTVTPGASASKLRVFAFFGTSVTGTAYVDNVMVTWGSQPAAYMPMRLVDDLERMRRYYVRWENHDNNYRMIANGFCTSTTQARFVLPMSPPMRAIPALSYSAVGDVCVSNSGGVTACTALAVNGSYCGNAPRIHGLTDPAGVQTVVLDATVGSAAFTAGDGVILCLTNTSGKWVALSADY